MIADASRSIEQLAAEVRRENDRRLAYDRMRDASDRVLRRLEILNRDGIERVTAADAQRIRRVLSGLPPAVLEGLPDTTVVQVLLDGVFDLQDRLFRWRDPGRDEARDDEEAPPPKVLETPGLRERIIELLTTEPNGLTAADIEKSTPGWGKECRRLLPTLVSEGLVTFVSPSGAGWKGRRLYFMAEVA